MYTLKIKVTKEILQRSMLCGTEEGPSSVGFNCAVALAVREIFPDAGVAGPFMRPFAMSDVPEIYDMEINLPSFVSDYIARFDGLVIRPLERLDLPEIEFDINLSDEVIEQIDIEEVKQLLTTSKTLELHEC